VPSRQPLCRRRGLLPGHAEEYALDLYSVAPISFQAA
jgi:hypothetical protein